MSETTNTIIKSPPLSAGDHPMAQSSSSSSSSLLVLPRHSGRVYVRGRIRRIWRPRFIELMDDGSLRYYEETTTTTVAATSSTTTATLSTNPQPPQRHGGGSSSTTTAMNTMSHHRNEYKYTLIVTGARILDVTTIRDLHTGLPRGTFGFVVRGQRLPPVSSSSSTTITTTITPLAPTTAMSSPDVMTDSFVFAEDEDDTGGGGGGSRETQGHNTSGAAAASTTTTTTAVVVPVRDYLCAVPTLEEAQMWVVALQWAASICQSHDNFNKNDESAMVVPNLPPPHPPLVDHQQHHWWNVDYTSMKSISNVPSESLMRQNVKVTPTNAEETTSAKDPVILKDNDHSSQASETTAVVMDDSKRSIPPSIDDNNNTKQERKDGNGKVLVTAVTGYSVVRYTTWTLEIVYQIHAMLLYDNDTTSSTTSSSSLNQNFMEGNEPTIQKQQRHVEQWSLQRSAAQFQAVANELVRLRSDNDPVPTGVHANNNDNDSDSSMLRRLPTWSSRPTIVEVDQSLSIVDSILRSWILSPDLVNTDTLKQFLGLENMDKVDNGSKSSNDSMGTALFLSLFRNVHCANPFSIRNKSTTTVPNHISSDVFVREWLQSVRRTGIQQRVAAASNSNTTTIGLLSLLFQNKQTNTNVSRIAIQLHHHHYHERNILYFGGAAAAVIGIMPTVLPLWKYIMPVIKIRFDYLVATWVGATYLGHRIGSASASSFSSRSARMDRGGTSNNPRHGVPLTTRQNKLSTTAPSSSTSLKSITNHPVDQQQAQQIPDSPKAASSSDNSVVMVTDYVDAVHSSDMDDFADFVPTTVEPYFHHQRQQNITDSINDDDESDGEATTLTSDDLLVRPTNTVDFLSSLSNDNNGMNDVDYLSTPLPKYPNNNGSSCWSQPSHEIFHVRGATYLRDKVKVCSGPSPLTCRGVDVWITDNPERHIARHPSILGGKLNDVDTFLVNFLLPFGNLVAYFEIPPLSSFPSKLRTVWTKFLKGDQQYRDARLKLLPVVVDGPWIVKTAVGPGKSPALLGKAIPLQYFFRDPDGRNRKGVYEVDVIITASTIAKGILSVVKSQTKTVSIAFAFIIEAVEQSELPETVLCSFQVHSLHLEDCPSLPQCNLD